MRRILPDMSVLEGTPQELASYELELGLQKSWAGYPSTKGDSVDLVRADLNQGLDPSQARPRLKALGIVIKSKRPKKENSLVQYLKDGKYICPNCDKPFGTRSGLYYHLQDPKRCKGPARVVSGLTDEARAALEKANS